MLHCAEAKLAESPFSTPAHCPQCGDLMVAPLLSEFVEDGEIRHHWACEACGETCVTTIPLCEP